MIMNDPDCATVEPVRGLSRARFSLSAPDVVIHHAFKAFCFRINSISPSLFCPAKKHGSFERLLLLFTTNDGQPRLKSTGGFEKGHPIGTGRGDTRPRVDGILSMLLGWGWGLKEYFTKISTLMDEVYRAQKGNRSVAVPLLLQLQESAFFQVGHQHVQLQLTTTTTYYD